MRSKRCVSVQVQYRFVSGASAEGVVLDACGEGSDDRGGCADEHRDSGVGGDPDISGAIDGQGIALARTTLAAWDLINRRLVRPFPDSLPLAKTYWIVCPKATSNLPKIVTFRTWLLAEAAEDTRCLKLALRC